MSSDGWRRLHPVSPVVRAGRAAVALAVVVLPSALGGRDLSESAIQLGLVVVLALLGFVSWLVTRWRIDGDDLRIETGLLRRQSLRFPLSQVQAIDVVRPGLARLFRVAELRLRLGGAAGATARLAYLPEREAEPLRARLLALAHGGAEPEAPAAEAPERVLASVPAGRLAASILLSDVGLAAEAVLAGLVATAVVSPAAAAGVAGGGAAWILAAGTLVWRRFNQEYRLTLAEAHDGLRLRSGLVALTAETIRPGRVQAVRMVEPLLWRLLGWCRLEVDLAGRQRAKGEGEAQRGQLRAVLPVGSRRLALELVERILADAPRERLPPPRRVLLKSPLRYRFLSWGRSDTCAVAVTGRIRRVTAWVPLVKVQSFRRVQGPVQRRLNLASIHLDTAGRSVHATLRDRDVREADVALDDLVRLARAARGG
ncbi:MAG: putative rane protein [Actinomycetota bacterium]|jgi:putative membrane protein